MKIFAPRWLRIAFTAGFIACAVLVVQSVIGVGGVETGVWAWLRVALNLFLLAYMGWMSFVAWFRPIARIDGRTFEWRPIPASVPQKTDLADVAGCRFQDAFELRLRLRSGDERAIHLSQIARHDRQGLVDEIQSIVDQG